MLYFYLITAKEEPSSPVKGRAFKAKVCAFLKKILSHVHIGHFVSQVRLDQIMFCD